MARILCGGCGGFVLSMASMSSFVASVFQDMRMATAAIDPIPGNAEQAPGRGREGDITPVTQPGPDWPMLRQAAAAGEVTTDGAKELAALSVGEAEGGTKELLALTAWLPGGGEGALGAVAAPTSVGRCCTCARRWSGGGEGTRAMCLGC